MDRINIDILQKIPKKRILDRLWYVDEIYKSIISDLSEYDFIMNYEFLYLAIKSYFYDIERLKHFHGIQRVEHYKIAGYMSKWINRMRPVSFNIRPETSGDTIPSTSVSEEALLINERLAIETGFVISEILGKDETEDERIIESVLYEMLYIFQYRDVQADHLAIWYKHLANNRDGYLASG
ncbi:MAG: hypothetical protein ABW098_11235 [Candidatus Thiodiazotropha sp.]